MRQAGEQLHRCNKEVKKMEQPREPIFYPNKETSVFTVSPKDNTLQSIDATLQRIEKERDKASVA